MDETYEGGVEPGVHGRGAQTKSLVAAAVEIDPKRKGFGRTRLRHIADGGALALKGFIESTVAVGATVRTDAWWGYTKGAVEGRKHSATTVKGSGRKAHEVLPAVHRVFALLHRVMLGTYQGAVRPKHLDAYLAEFEFRFNRRHAKSRTLLFQRALSCAVLTRAPEYWRIVGRPAPRVRVVEAA